MPKQAVEIIDASDSPEFMRCADYILCRELGIVVDGKMKRFTIEEFAQRHGVATRQTIYNWLAKWEQMGLLKKTREAMFTPVGEEVILADRKVLSAWPGLIEKTLDLAQHAKNERVALEAIMFLREKIVEPLMQQQPEVGAEEAEYIQTVQGSLSPFNPLGILDVPAATPPATASESE